MEAAASSKLSALVSANVDLQELPFHVAPNQQRPRHNSATNPTPAGKRFCTELERRLNVDFGRLVVAAGNGFLHSMEATQFGRMFHCRLQNLWLRTFRLKMKNKIR